MDNGNNEPAKQSAVPIPVSGAGAPSDPGTPVTSQTPPVSSQQPITSGVTTPGPPVTSATPNTTSQPTQAGTQSDTGAQATPIATPALPELLAVTTTQPTVVDPTASKPTTTSTKPKTAPGRPKKDISSSQNVPWQQPGYSGTMTRNISKVLTQGRYTDPASQPQGNPGNTQVVASYTGTIPAPAAQTAYRDPGQSTSASPAAVQLGSTGTASTAISTPTLAPPTHQTVQQFDPAQGTYSLPAPARNPPASGYTDPTVQVLTPYQGHPASQTHNRAPPPVPSQPAGYPQSTAHPGYPGSNPVPPPVQQPPSGYYQPPPYGLYQGYPPYPQQGYPPYHQQGYPNQPWPQQPQAAYPVQQVDPTGHPPAPPLPPQQVAPPPAPTPTQRVRTDPTISKLESTVQQRAPQGYYKPSGQKQNRPPSPDPSASYLDTPPHSPSHRSGLLSLQQREEEVVQAAYKQIQALRAGKEYPLSGPGKPTTTGIRTLSPARLDMPSPTITDFPSKVEKDSSTKQLPNTAIWRLRFSGSEMDLDSYLSQLDCVAAANGWDDTVKGTLLLANLEKDATRVMSQIPQGCMSYTVIAEKLREMFTPAALVMAYQAQFLGRMRQRSETAHEYALALRDLAKKAYPEKTPQELEKALIQQFIRGQPFDVRFVVSPVSYTSLVDAMAAVTRHEAYCMTPADPEPQGPARFRTSSQAASGRTNWSPPAPPTPQEQHTGYQEYSPEPRVENQEYQDSSADDSYDPLADLIGQLAGLKSHTSAAQPSQDKPCFFCGKGGHFWTTCNLLINKLRENGFRGTALLKSIRPSGDRTYGNRGPGPRGPNNGSSSRSSLN